jgi:hypothetical protein
VKLVMQMTREAIKAQERDPFTAYANRVRELNYGNSYYFKVKNHFHFRKLQVVSDYFF